VSYVVDASVAIKWFVTEDLHEHALTLFDQPETLIAPDLICLEIANVAWKKAKRGQISPDQAQFIEQANKRCIQHIYPSSEFSERALSIALHIDHKVYDCVYLACAEANGSILVSADKSLCRITRLTEFAHLVSYLEDIGPSAG
jgi:predicted nucleic acid-binding protein